MRNQLGIFISILFHIIVLTLTKVEAQYSVYDKITGVDATFTRILEDTSKSPYLTIQLKSRYDDVFRAHSQKQQVELARWSYGASVNWRVSKTQSWHFDLYREGEIVKAVRLDSSWNLSNRRKSHRFRISHRRVLGPLPFVLQSYFQLYEEAKKARVNYGLGIRWRLASYEIGFASEYKSWLPFFQALLNENVEVLFPTLANLRQIQWSFAGGGKTISLKSYIRIGKLLSDNRTERDYTFRPSAKVQTIMSLLRINPKINWQVRLSYLSEQVTGDGILRFRGRKYGNLHLHAFDFSELRLSLSRKLKKTSLKLGAIYQKLSGKTNATIQAWPFDNSSVDFLGAKQSMVGNGSLSLIRTWVQLSHSSPKKFQLSLLAEYIHASTQARVKTWGSALIFASENIDEHKPDFSRDFIRIGLSPTLILTRRMDINLKFSQWIPIGSKNDNEIKGKVTGGTFGQVVLGFYL
jgi:hypothetical protein